MSFAVYEDEALFVPFRTAASFLGFLATLKCQRPARIMPDGIYETLVFKPILCIQPPPQDSKIQPLLQGKIQADFVPRISVVRPRIERPFPGRSFPAVGPPRLLRGCVHYCGIR